jgi:hypothetical protein
MAANFAGNLSGPSTPLPHFREHTVGSGHATLALRPEPEYPSPATMTPQSAASIELVY